MSQDRNNNYEHNDCEEELADSINESISNVSRAPNKSRIFKRPFTNGENTIEKRKRLNDIRMNEQNNEETPFKRGKSKDLPVEEAQKTILYSSIPRDYKYRFNPSQVRFNYYYIYLFIDLDISML